MDRTDTDYNEELKKEGTTQTEKTKKPPFRHDFNNVTFPQRKHPFRATMSSAPDGVLLWLEDKTTKQQWQNTFTDVAGCGPPGIPAEAIIVFTKVRMRLLMLSVVSC